MSGKWYRPDDGVMVFVSDSVINTGNVAGFDLDGTLIGKKENDKHTSCIFLLPGRKEKLKNFIDRGYTIVVFTNHKLYSGENISHVLLKLNRFIQILNLPLILMVSFKDDYYRKPEIGMWRLSQNILGHINLAFYSGNSAGRKRDLSSVDKIFAEKIGIPFYFPEDIF